MALRDYIPFVKSSDEGDDLAKRGGDHSAIGSTGQTFFGGYAASEDAADLFGPRRADAFMRMLRDTTIIAAGVRIFLNLISGATWQAEAPKMDSEADQAKADEVAKAVEDMITDHATPWPRIVRRVTLFRFYGFSIMEWIAKLRDDGLTGMLDVKPRPNRTIDRWETDENGEVTGVWQRVDGKPDVLIPRERLIYAVDDTFTENPEGLGLLRHVKRAADRLKAFEMIEQIGFENDLQGVPVAYAPLTEIDNDERYTKAQRNRFRKPLNDFVQGHIRNKRTGLLLDSEVYRGTGEQNSPSGTRKWAVDVLRGQGGAFEEVGATIDRINKEIARVLGVEHIMLGADGSGSLAMSKSKVGTFYLTLMTTQQELVDIIERDWLRPICEMNGWPRELWPSLACEEIRDEDIEQITGALEKMARAGATLREDDPVIAEVRQMLGVSPPPDPEIDPMLDPAGEIDPLNPQNDPVPPDDIPPPKDEGDPSMAKARRKWVRSSKRKGAY